MKQFRNWFFSLLYKFWKWGFWTWRKCKNWQEGLTKTLQ